jgi:hypothetical protein
MHDAQPALAYPAPAQRITEADKNQPADDEQDVAEVDYEDDIGQ